MSTQKELKAIRDAILVAENSIRTAKQLLSAMMGWDMKVEKFSPDSTLDGLSHYNTEEAHIVEGVFTGDSMLGSDGNTYPVPQNYASKSLLVQWSRLKAIIAANGKISYKIIEEIEYENQIGIVTKAWDKYQITTDSRTYNVLVAAVTFHKCNIWDTVRIRIPKGKAATYAVIENVIPKI